MTNNALKAALILLDWDINEFGYAVSFNHANRILFMGENKIIINQNTTMITCQAALSKIVREDYEIRQRNRESLLHSSNVRLDKGER